MKAAASSPYPSRGAKGKAARIALPAAEVARKHELLRSELGGSGELRGGAGLVLPDETTVLRLGSDGIVTRQGPLVADSSEHLTAYYEVDCETPERAHEIAARLLDDHVTAVEVRRIHDTA